MMLTSSSILFADPSIVAFVVAAAACPAAAPVHPKHPSAPRPRPLLRITHCDWLFVEPQALQAANEVLLLLVDLLRGARRHRGEQQGAVGAQHSTRLCQGDGGGTLPVHGQSQKGGADLEQDAVPLTVHHWVGVDLQRSRGGLSTFVPELQLTFSHLEGMRGGRRLDQNSRHST